MIINIFLLNETDIRQIATKGKFEFIFIGACWANGQSYDAFSKP